MYFSKISKLFMYSLCVKSVFYSAFVMKCTDMCKHRFEVHLLQNPPLSSSTSCSVYKQNETVKNILE
jgi:hypothetical protein